MVVRDMNFRDATVSEYLIETATRIRKSAWRRSQPADELPLRSELFSADQMEQHGKALATAHKLGAEHARNKLLTRLAQNENVLLDACAHCRLLEGLAGRVYP